MDSQVDALVCKTRIWVRTCDGWPAKRIRKTARVFTQVAKHAYTVDLRWVAARWNISVDFAYELELDQSQYKWWPNETQVERKSKTFVALRRVRLART